MPILRNPSLLFKAARQLGAKALRPYLVYQFKLRSGILRRQTPPGGHPAPKGLRPEALFKPPTKAALKKAIGKGAQELIAEADQVLDGQVRLFGGPPRPFSLGSGQSWAHWTSYADHMPDGSDIKFVWEVGRFGWATTLARAYALTGNERYTQAFWQWTGEFIAANPPNLGPHWSSAQEVALRLTSLAFCYSVFATSPQTRPEHGELLAASLAAHAERIPPTLAYSRAQNNNHLLSEALGLYTAAVLLPAHPKAGAWRELGRQAFVEGILNQIDDQGAYNQHSSNYQRLMLQLGLWAQRIADQAGESWPAEVEAKLAEATRWLLAVTDAESGGAPNLGPNDGAYILPLSSLPFSDYRPVLQAASQAFLGGRAFKAGPWDEMALWLLSKGTNKRLKAEKPRETPLRLEGGHTWAYLRAAHFDGRPGHADQLHLDIWWRGRDMALDPGSYRYTAPPPWDNALAATRAHNTLTVDGADQMTPAGRFLWLDWAQAQVLEREEQKGRLVAASAQHDGYRKFGLLHRRTVTLQAAGWRVEDELLPQRSKAAEISARLHWLLPNWDWELKEQTLHLVSPLGKITLKIEADSSTDLTLGLLRAGQVITGESEPDPILGWFSPTYDVKRPALSLVAAWRGVPPVKFTSTWILPE